MPAAAIAMLKQVCEAAPPHFLAIYLYGSIARGTERRDSDMDLGVLTANDRPTTAELEAFIDRIESVAHRAVDLIVVNNAPADLVHRILRDGVLLLDRDRRARLEFEVRRRNEYFDLEPIRRQYRSARTRTARS